MSGITQLVAIGAQDVHLTGNPDVSFFRNNFKRYTNFSLTTRRQRFSGNPTAGSTTSVTIEKNGDLLNYMYLVAIDSSGRAIDVNSWSNCVSSVELLIGGQVVDTQDSVFTEEIAIDTLANNFSKCYAGGNHGGDASTSLWSLSSTKTYRSASHGVRISTPQVCLGSNLTRVSCVWTRMSASCSRTTR